MESENKLGAGTIILATLGGAVVGATVALLLAPKSGKETRLQMESYVDTATETIKRVPEAMKQAAHAAQELVKDAATDAAKHAEAAARHALKEA